jgi:hypothetical protein
VSGEAGIGKTAIAAALAHEAELRGAVVIWGRAWEFAAAPPYFPIWPCLRALGISAVDASHESLQDGDAFHLWETVVVSLARASSTTAVVWILEDLHAADLGTLDLLTFLAQPLRAMRALVVGTVRNNDSRLTDRMMQRLTRMARDGLDVRLEPLSSRAVAAVAEDTIGCAVSETAVQRLVELTGGNPLFVVEYARAFRAAGGAEASLGSLPPTLRQAVLDRVALLPDTTRKALACGAVLGREFSALLVSRMGDWLPAAVIDSLLAAVRAGLVKETRAGHFTFEHVLMRDAIDDALGSELRAELHGRADAALAALGDDADVLVERARHALAALGSGDAANAVAIADRASALLEREGAFDRAFELLARVAEARASGLLPPAPAARTLHDARVAHAAGRSEMSRRLCEDVAAAARAAGDAELLGRAALLYGADVRPGFAVRPLIALLEEARAALGGRAPELECRLLARLGTALTRVAEPAVPIQMARDAIGRARATRDDALMLDVMDLAGWALIGWAALDERIALSTEMLERSLRANDLPRALVAYGWLAFDHIEAGEFDAFERDTHNMLVVSDEIGHPRHRWRALLIASARATTLGHFAESDRHVTEVAELAALIDDHGIAWSLTTHNALRKRIQRKDDEVRAALAIMASVPIADVPLAETILAIIHATCTARIEDVDETRRQLAIVGARGSMLYGYPLLLAALAEAYALAGTDGERRHVREALARARTKDITGNVVPYTYEGTVPRLLGLLDAALGELARAEQELREAHALAIERGHAPWVAQTAYELAKLARCRGRPDEARGWIEVCLPIARELGMTGLLASAHADAPTNVGAQPAEMARALQLDREGELWRIEREATVVRVRDTRGMRILARLIERPNEEIHVLALASDEPMTSVPESTAGDVLDERARRAYRNRLAELEDDIAKADRSGAAAPFAKLLRERDAIQRELVRAAGLGGRMRRAGSATERARINVQKRLKEAIARIAEADAATGQFFARAICTGTFCCFSQ